MLICPECAQPLSESVHVECPKCGWHVAYREGIPVYLSQRELADPVVQQYFDNYDRIAADDVVKSIQDERYLHYQALNLAERVRDVDGREVCDVGCGKGFLARALLSRNPTRLTVVDIAVTYLRGLAPEPRLHPVIANAENLPFRGTFDVIVTTDVMEHVLNVGSFLYSVNRALKPNGRAYVRVPFRENLLGYSPFLGCPYRFVHLRSFNRGILRTYFREAGFAIERFHYDGFAFDVPRAVWSAGRARRRLFAAFARLAKRGLGDPFAITRSRHPAVRVFLRPIEITTVARKVRELETIA
jgi:SAM-dependent methyltransferase